MNRPFIAAFAAAFVAASLAACGGSGGTSKEEFISEADAICERFDARFNRLVDQVNTSLDLPSTPENDQALSKLDQEKADEVGRGITELEGLTPPDGDEATFQKLLDSLSREQDLIADQSLASSSSDFDTRNTLQDQVDQVESESQGIGAGYGFKECP